MLFFEVWMLYSDFWTYDGQSGVLNIYTILLGCVFDDVHREDLNVNAMDGKRIHGGDYYVEFTEGLEREMMSPSYFTYFAACFINLCFSSQR